MKKKTAAGIEFLEIPGDPNGATILLLHGFGADGEDLASLHHVFQGTPRPTWLFPNAPVEITLAPGWKGRAWFDLDIEGIQKAYREGDFQAISAAMASDLDKARNGIEEAIGELALSIPKLFLGGFSQGAVLAIETAFHLPERCGGLLIFSGTLVNEEKWQRLSHLHAATPFFQSHGTDDPLLPYVRAEELEKVLIAGGLKGKLHSFHGGHEIPPQILSQLHTFLTTHLTPTTNR